MLSRYTDFWIWLTMEKWLVPDLKWLTKTNKKHYTVKSAWKVTVTLSKYRCKITLNHLVPGEYGNFFLFGCVCVLSFLFYLLVVHFLFCIVKPDMLFVGFVCRFFRVVFYSPFLYFSLPSFHFAIFPLSFLSPPLPGSVSIFYLHYRFRSSKPFFNTSRFYTGCLLILLSSSVLPSVLQTECSTEYIVYMQKEHTNRIHTQMIGHRTAFIQTFQHKCAACESMPKNRFGRMAASKKPIQKFVVSITIEWAQSKRGERGEWVGEVNERGSLPLR